VYGVVVRFAVIAMLVAGAAGAAACYEAPDYGATMFRCDAAHACPEGQTCIDGLCRGGGGSGQGSGVACGAQMCASGQQCCIDFISAPRCLAAGVSCPGLAATCDGLEDCAAGACCFIGARADCTTASCNDPICLQPADCPAAQPMCCLGFTTGEPWGHCLTICP
jgi:hypothetical protein